MAIIGKRFLLTVGFACLTVACTADSERYIQISTPTDEAVIEPSQPLIVKGTGRGLYENNVVIQLQDSQGNQLIQTPTTMKTQEIGGEGVWQKNVVLPQPVPEKLQLLAYSPSPKEGDEAISSQPIMLNVDTAMKTTLENTEWQLSQYQDKSGKTSAVISSTSISATFIGKKVSGNAGCNRYFGHFQISPDGLFQITGQIGSTMMACAPEITEQEQQYLKNLTMAASYQLENDTLVLLNKDQQAVLAYQRVKPLTLENTAWQATGINNGRGGVVANKNTHLATIRFSQGKAQGNTGCNNFSVSVEINDQKLRFGQARTTRKFCAEDGVMEQEQQFLKALANTVSYDFKDGKLSLRDHKGSLMLAFKKQPK